MGLGLKRDRALAIVGITKHQFYHKSNGKKQGRKPTQHTPKLSNNEIVTVKNDKVVNDMKKIQSNPDTDCGYKKMDFYLMQKGYFINHKKVYRLMYEFDLLKIRYKKISKEYAKYRIVIPENRLEVFEMDIKYVWIVNQRRHAFIFIIIDTFTRIVLYWDVGFTMKSTHIKKGWEKVFIEHLQAEDLLKKGVSVEVRNDNDPRFSGKIIKNFFEKNYLNQVFIHPYTPQENGHIESFHNILSCALNNVAYWSIDDLIERLNIFYQNYNNLRIHGSIAYLTPVKFKEFWDKGLITRKLFENKKVKFKLKVPYQTLSGNGNQREVPCINYPALDVQDNLK